MNDSKNTILAIVLSGLVLLIWQYFFGLPYLEKQKQAQPPPAQQSQPVAGSPQRPQESGSAAQVPTAPLAGLGLIGGYLTARETGIRPLGGVVLGLAGLYAGRTWVARAGWPDRCSNSP